MRLEDKEKTTFWASNRRWHWTVMPFGLKCADACFQKVMDDALAHHPNAKCYIDDVLTYITTLKQHLGHIRQAFDSIAAIGLKAHPSKIVFGAQEVPYLGHLLFASGVRPMDAKIKTIVEMPAPVDVSGVRSFMGLASYNRKFVPNLSNLAEPLNELTEANTPSEWTTAKEQAYQELKNALVSSPVPRAPEFKRPFELHTD